jgi:hypothetical protein
MSAAEYILSWKIVRGRECGSSINAVLGRGGFNTSPAASRIEVLGGARRLVEMGKSGEGGDGGSGIVEPRLVFGSMSIV